MNLSFHHLNTVLRGYWHDTAMPEAADLNDAQLWHIARQHRLTPVLYRWGQTHANALLETPHLKASMLHFAARQVRSLHAMQALVARLHERGVPVVPFKGLLLALQLYEDVALRPSADTDLYVPTAHIHDAVAALQDLGYHNELLQQYHLDTLVPRVYTLEFSHPQQRMLLDVHWDVTDGYVPPLFAPHELTPHPLPGTELSTFTPEVTLALIAVHGAKDSWAHLSALLDLALFVKRYPHADYAAVVTRLQRHGLVRMLTVGAVLIRHFWDVPLPSAIAAAVDERAQALALLLRQRLESHPDGLPPTGWAKVRLNLQFRQTSTQKWRYLRFKSRVKKVDLSRRGRLPRVLAHWRRVWRT